MPGGVWIVTAEARRSTLRSNGSSLYLRLFVVLYILSEHRSQAYLE